MGQINSIPVVSQIKSLVQVISGDEVGARKTQEEFARKGIIVSQFNSMAHAIMGNEQEARDIQHEFLADLEVAADNAPVIGHIKSGVHMALGDEEKAREVALSATKSTVVALSAAAGAACGPGAAACGAALAVSANAAWDGADSAIAGENRGIVEAVNHIVDGNAEVNEIFDTVAGQSLLAAGGALAAKAGVAKSGTKTGISGGLLCKRSIVTRPELFDNSLPSIKGETLKLLPSSLTEIELNSNLLSQPEDLALAIYSIFVVFKLISVGHPASKPYYEEICGKMWPQQNLDECESKLFLALNKFGNIRDDESSLSTSLFEDSFEALIFEMNHLIKNTTIGFNLKRAICYNYLEENLSKKCFGIFEMTLAKLRLDFRILDNARIRRKRGTACSPRILVGGMGRSSKFASNHILGDEVFGKVSQNLNDLNPKSVAYLNEKINFRSGVHKNTLIRSTDLDNLNIADAIDTGKSYLGSPIYRTSESVNLIVVDHLKAGAGPEVSIGKGTFSFTRGLDGELVHLKDTQFIEPPTVKILPQ